MRNTLPLLALVLVGCGSHSHKANDLITAYVKTQANDPSSYQSVSFTKPRLLTYGDVSTGRPDTTPLTGALISHSFRAKNGFGALVVQTEAFVVDSSAGKVQRLSEMQDSLASFTKRLVEKQVQEMQHAADSMADARTR